MKTIKKIFAATIFATCACSYAMTQLEKELKVVKIEMRMCELESDNKKIEFEQNETALRNKYQNMSEEQKGALKSNLELEFRKANIDVATYKLALNMAKNELDEAFRNEDKAKLDGGDEYDKAIEIRIDAEINYLIITRRLLESMDNLMYVTKRINML